MPPATTISDSPRVTACAARATALRPEPQTLLMVMAATRGAQPPLRAAWRAGFWPRPAWTTLPRMASSICLASRPARRMASATILPPSSGADKPARPPWNLPMGVRTAERITGLSVLMRGLQRRDALYYSAIGKRKVSRWKGLRGRRILRPRNAILFCGGACLAFIGARTIVAGYGNTQQTEIDAELRAMM